MFLFHNCQMRVAFRLLILVFGLLLPSTDEVNTGTTDGMEMGKVGRLRTVTLSGEKFTEKVVFVKKEIFYILMLLTCIMLRVG